MELKNSSHFIKIMDETNFSSSLSEPDLWKYKSQNDDPVVIPSGLEGIISEEDFLQKPLSAGFVISFMIIYISLMALGCFENILLLATVISGKYIRTFMDFYLTSLAVSNLGNIFLSIPFTIDLLFSNQWRIGEGGCRFVKYVEGVLLISIILSLITLAITNYGLIFWKSKKQKANKSKVLSVVIFLIWAISLAVAVPLLFIHKLELKLKYDVEKEEISEGGFLCTIRKEDSVLDATLYITVSFGVIYIPCFLTSLFLYIKGWHFLWIVKPVDLFSARGSSRKEVEKITITVQLKKRLFIIFATITCVYLVCILPNFVTNIYFQFNPNTKLNRVYWHIFSVLEYSTGVTVPLVYLLLHSAAKEQAGTIMTCTCCNEEDEEVIVSNRPALTTRLSTLTVQINSEGRRRSSVAWNL